MAHIRKPLAGALAANTAVCAVEVLGAARAGSLSLLMDAVHNCSDELALICLFLAYALVARLSRGLQRSANFLNSIGLVVLSIAVGWQAVDHILHPKPVIGWVPIAIGLIAAGGNWYVARLLRDWQRYNAAIRLAYAHNLGDAYVSLAPVVAGLLVTASGRPVFDPLVATGVAAWLLISTVQEVLRSRQALLWPEDARCPHEGVPSSATQTTQSCGHDVGRESPGRSRTVLTARATLELDSALACK